MSDKSNNILVEYLAVARKARGLTQRELADKIGTTQQEISKFEVGTHASQLDRYLKILSTLDYELVLRPRERDSDDVLEEDSKAEELRLAFDEKMSQVEKMGKEPDEYAPFEPEHTAKADKKDPKKKSKKKKKKKK